MAFNLDTWQNFLTGLGMINSDPRLATEFKASKTLGPEQLRNLFRDEGIGKQIVEIPVLDMTASGFEVDGDPDGMVIARLEETGMLAGLRNMIRWSDLFGGALGVIGADDGQRYDKPLNINNLRNVTHLHVFDRNEVTWTSSDLYGDLRNPKYGQPEFYRVTPVWGSPFTVHESRCLKMTGMPVDNFTSVSQQGWGDSVLQSVYDAIRQFGNGYDSAEFIVNDFVHGVYKLKDLGGKLSTPEGEKELMMRFGWLAKTQHVANDKIIDLDEEDYTKVTSSVTGIPDILDRFMLRISGATGIPVSRLFGRSPAGLNATGQADDVNYNKKIKARQTQDYQPMLERLCRLIFRSTDYFFDGVEPDRWTIEFNPINPPTAKEAADQQKAQTDEVIALVGSAIMTEDEARDLPMYRDRFNLIGDAPEPEPEPNPGETAPDPSNPTDPNPEDETLAQDGLNPARRLADILRASRRQVFDSRGHRHSHSDTFVVEVVSLYRTRFATDARARAWVVAHALDANNVQGTRSRFRFIQRAALDCVPGTQRVISLAPGIEITLARPRG